MFKLNKLLMMFCALLLLTACDDGGSSSSDNRVNTTAVRSIPTHQYDPAIQGFDLSFKTGDFWEYQWQKTERRTSTTTYGSSPRTTEEAGTIKISLGETMRIMGVDFYKATIEYTGDVNASDAGLSWQYITWHSNVLYGYKNNEGSSSNGVYKIFDAQNGAWEGGLLLGGSYNAGASYETAPTLTATARTDGTYRVFYPMSPLLSALGVYHHSVYETFKPGIGLTEKSYTNNSRFSLSGITTTTNTQYSLKLIDSSFGL